MKVQQMRKVLIRFGEVAKRSGDTKGEEALASLAGVLAEHDRKTVKAFVKETRKRQNRGIDQ